MTWRNKLKTLPFVAQANAIIKAYSQERKATHSLEYYRHEAAQRGIICPQGEALRSALCDRLKIRATNCWPKPKGQLHIFLAYSVSNWEAILPRTLTPFGKVTTFEWRFQGFDHLKPDWLQYRDTINRAILESFHKANREQTVDVVVGYLSGYTTAPETLIEMANTGAAIFNFCWDDKLNFPGELLGGRYSTPAAIAHVVDLNLTNAPDSMVKYAVHGGLAMFWPEAAHPEVHHPYEVPFEFDVSFVGACYGWRPKFISLLQRLGIKVECFGNGWPNGPLSDEEMIKLYSRSRINLGFAGVGHSRKLMCLKGRDFEVPMSGGLYLTQDNPELKLVFEVDREIVTYKDERNCADKIWALLVNPEMAATIRTAGRARCLLEHTYEVRWAQVFSMAGIII